MLTLPTVIAALPDDDRRAFIEALWQKYHSYMFFIARRYYLGAEVLEDVVSDSLLRLMERTETLRELTPPQTFAYIRRTVRSQAVERARKERRERMLENSGWTVEADALMDDWKRVELEEELEALMDAVDLLPERERRAVQLKYGEQRDTAQVAETMGVAESTARKYLLNARRLLKRALYENGGERDGD